MRFKNDPRITVIVVGLIFLIYAGFSFWYRFIQPMNRPVTPLHEVLSTASSQWLNTSRAIQPEDLRGRIILIDFWTYCCINCLHVLPHLKRLEEKFGDKLAVIGVHSGKFDNEKQIDPIRDAVLKYSIEHPVVNDADFKIWQAFGVNAWPTLVLMNPDGKIELAVSGEGHHEMLEREIHELQARYLDYNQSPLPIELEAEKTPQRILNYPGKMTFVSEFEGSPAILISDTNHHRILAARLGGEVFLSIGGKAQPGFQDGDFESARFHSPQGIVWKDQNLYVADTQNHALRKIDFKTKRVSTLAGTGEQGFERKPTQSLALKTPLASPWDLAFYPDASQLVMAMAGTHQLWSYDVAKKTVSVIAGNGREFIDDGPYPVNSLSQPSGLSVYQNQLYFIDSETSALRVYDGKQVKTLLGTGLFDFGFRDGGPSEALMQHPLGLVAHSSGIFIADTYNHALRRYDYKTKRLETIFVGDQNQRLNEPNDVQWFNDQLYVLDTNHHRVAVFQPKKNTLSELALFQHDQKPGVKTSDESLSALPYLPHLKTEKTVALKMNATIKVALDFKLGWKLNEKAPSYWELFLKTSETEKKRWKRIAKFSDVSELRQSIQLPELPSSVYQRQNESQSLVLQGSFYFCEEKNTSVCYVQSVRLNLHFQEQGLESLTIPIHP